MVNTTPPVRSTRSTGPAVLVTLGDCAGSAAGGGFHRIVDGEDLGQAGDLEHLEDPALGAHQGEVTIVAAQALEPPDQHTEAGGVEEVDPLQVDDDLLVTLADQLDQPLPQPGGGVDVDLATNGQHCETVPLRYVEAQVHGWLLVNRLVDRLRRPTVRKTDCS